MTSYKEQRFRSDDGLDLYYRDYGDRDAPAVLCLHGLTRNSRDFADLAAHLSDRFRVLAADVRGRGQSDRDSDYSHYALPTYVDDTWCLLDHAGVERFALIGTSMGGLMSMTMGAARPDRVWAIVLNDIGPVVEQAGLDRIKGYVGKTDPPADWDEAIAAVRAINAEAFPDFTDADWRAFAHRLFREENGRPAFDYDPDIARAMAEAEGAAVPPDLWPVYEALGDIPLLAIRGSLSDILSHETLQAMGRRKPKTTAVTVPRVGHAPMLDEPVAIRAIDEFLDRNRP